MDQDRIPDENENEFNENEFYEEDEEDTLIELTDENGETTLYEQLGSFDFEGNTYLALCEPGANEQEDENEDLMVFLLRYDHDENGQEVFTVPEDDEADKAFDYFNQIVSEQEE